MKTKIVLMLLVATAMFAVGNVAQGVIVIREIQVENDDAEEYLNTLYPPDDPDWPDYTQGRGWLDSSDLELGSEGDGGLGWQAIAMQYDQLGIPQGATITSAKLTFTVDDSGVEGESNDFTILAEAADNAAVYGYSLDAPFWPGYAWLDSYDITSRARTAASVSWAPAALPAVGTTLDTPDIASLIQEVVNRPGWSENNRLTVMIYPDVYLALSDPTTGGSTSVQEIEFEGGPGSDSPTLTVQFTPSSIGAAECLVVDDFEEHTSGEMWKVWMDGAGDCDGNDTDSGAILYEESGTTYDGTGSMRYVYDNDGTVEINPCGGPLTRPKYSRAVAQIGDLPSGIDPNWLADGIRSLSLKFRGDAGNDIEPMWVELGDTDGNSATVSYGDNPGEDINDIKDPSWHEWNIDLQDFSDGGVNLADVNTIAIGFGEIGATEPGGSGTVYVDDIRVCIRRCILAGRDANFAIVDYVADCVVDYKEVEFMAENWLDTGSGGGEFVPEYEITIPNAGFEDRILGDGAVVWWRTNHNPNSWYYADHNNEYEGQKSPSDIFQWNPGLDVPIVGNWTWNRFGGIAPEGDNIVAVDNSIGGIAQLLDGELFDHTKAYQLTAQVGGLEVDSYWGNWWLGYGLEILVGGTINTTETHGYRTINGGTRIAYVEKTEEECGFEDETFYTVTLTYVPDVADAALDGQPLQIRVMSHSDNGYAFFDDVKFFRGSASGSGSPPEPDLYPDLVINFKDFAVLAERFLDEDGMFPEP